MTFKKGEIPKGSKPFKKGQSGNPAGRPPNLPELDALMALVLSEEKDSKTEAETILRKWIELAKKGNLKAGEMLFDRGYGKPRQAMEVTGKDGKDLEFGINQASQDKIASLLKAINGAGDK